jgi:hypothetical protein
MSNAKETVISMEIHEAIEDCFNDLLDVTRKYQDSPFNATILTRAIALVFGEYLKNVKQDDHFCQTMDEFMTTLSLTLNTGPHKVIN